MKYSNDLIRKSDILDFLNKESEQIDKDNEAFSLLSDDTIDSIQASIEAITDKIKNMPVKYSVDVIVEKIKERTNFLEDCTKCGNKNANQQYKSYSTMMVYEVADLIDDILDIVKNG